MVAPTTDKKPIFQVMNTLGTNVNAINFDWTCRPNEWHHLVGIKSGTSINLCFDGQANTVVADTFSGTALNSDDQLTLGIDDDSFLFVGALDDVCAYSRALSVSEVKRLYELGECGLWYCRIVMELSVCRHGHAQGVRIGNVAFRIYVLPPRSP
jgi:hypothetical protein